MRNRDILGAKRAIAAGANIDAEHTPFTPSTRAGWTPLFYAVENADVEMVSLLLANGANARHKDRAQWTPLFVILISNSGDSKLEECIDMLAQHGCDINATSVDGKTILHEVVKQSRCAIVDKLLQHGAAVNQRDFFGSTPLIYAATIPANECTIRSLIANGADVRMLNNEGSSFADFAKRYYGDQPTLLKEWLGADMPANTDQQNVGQQGGK